jgi:hypothetical protein
MAGNALLRTVAAPADKDPMWLQNRDQMSYSACKTGPAVPHSGYPIGPPVVHPFGLESPGEREDR